MMKKNYKPIFSNNSDNNKNTYINWMISTYEEYLNTIVMAEGYSIAAIKLIEIFLEDNSLHQGDKVIFPILFSINQAIELYLKVTINEIEEINNKPVSKFKTHDIKLLFNDLISKIKKEEGDSKKLNEFKENLESYITEIYEHISSDDSKGKGNFLDFTRYPTDNNKNPHFYVKEMNNIIIDLENLLSRFKEIKENLEGLAWMYKSRLDYINECKLEYHLCFKE